MLKAHRTTHTADNNLKKQKFLKHFTFKVTALSYLLHVPPYFFRFNAKSNLCEGRVE